MDSVATVGFDYAIAMRLHMLLDDIADFTISFTWFDDGNGLLQRFIRYFNQILVLFGNIANEERFIQIAMETSMIDCHIDIADIAILQLKTNSAMKNHV